MSIPRACERCGGPLAWLRSEAALEVYRCPACDHMVVVAPDDGPQAAAWREETLKDVEVVWREGHPSEGEARALRKLLPHLGQQYSTDKFVQTFHYSRSFDLGLHHHVEAMELLRRGKALGLDVRFH